MVQNLTLRTLRVLALLISIISIIYNGAEGAVSIALGFDSKSRSLIFFGIQSGIEVASAMIVTGRFWAAVRNDFKKQSSSVHEENGRANSEEDSAERRAREERNLRCALQSQYHSSSMSS